MPKRKPITEPVKQVSAHDTKGGINYLGAITGKYLFRVRQRYVADQVAPMLSAKQVGAAKLDLVLRGIALLPEHAGARDPGFVLRRGVTYEDLHDLCRDPRVFTTDLPENAMYDPVVIDKKRAWVAAQLRVLERRGLVRRVERPGRRPDLIVLRDDASGKPFDDPGAVARKPGNAYVTVHGHVIADPRFRSWGAGELAAYYCAMTAERFDPKRPDVAGTGVWFRQIGWFAGAYRKPGHVTYPFGERTLRQGFLNLAEQGWIATRDVSRWRGERFEHPRRVYTNKFVARHTNVIDLAEYLAELDDDLAL